MQSIELTKPLTTESLLREFESRFNQTMDLSKFTKEDLEDYANKVRTIVDEVAKFKKEEIEFLFETIKNGMIPGKHLGIAMEVVNKLKSQYQLLNRKEAIIKKKTKSKDDVVKQQIDEIQQEEKQRLKEQDGELWVEE